MDNSNLNITTIKKFWDWFSAHHNDFGEYFDNEELLSELDHKITDLGDFVWEIGPGINANNQLVISPGGDLDLLSNTKQIISCTKAVPNWEFHYAKPPKQWDFIFDLEKFDGSQVQIDASQWKYVLLKYDDGMFEIIIQTPDLKKLDEEEKLIASEILLDGILGEEKRMLLICDIDVVEEFEMQYANKSNDITKLSDQLISLAI